MNQPKASKILNVFVREEVYEKFIEISDQYASAKSKYARRLIYAGIDSCKQKKVVIPFDEEIRMADEYITIRVSEECFEYLKKISISSGISLPRITGYFMEKGMEREGNIT